MQKQRITSWVVLIVCALLIKIFSFFPFAVEQYYARGVYPYISSLQRILLGWIPFSMGDILYAACSIYGLRKLVQFVRALLQKKASRSYLIRAGKKLVFVCLLIYVLFNALWGLNYNRLPMGSQMGLVPGAYSTESLGRLLDSLVERLNNFDSSARIYRSTLTKKKTLFQEAVDTYQLVAEQYPSFAYSFTSLKPSMYSYAGNYLGFTGYYNPFSGEAQANTTVPSFVQPFTTCHEIGHQLGYAKENEANFAGFLAGRSSGNPAFRYSVYFDMYAYAIRELYLRDSIQVSVYDDKLNANVKRDFETIREFYRRYENPIEPLIRRLYGNYLRANEQPEGLESYNEVVALLVAYHGRYGGL